MKGLQVLKSALVGGASLLSLTHAANARTFDVPDGDLSTALVAYVKQSSAEIIFSDDDVRGHRSRGAKGDYTEAVALTRILQGTGFTAQTMPSNAVEIVPAARQVEVAQVDRRPAAPSATPSVETVVVTAQKKAEDIQQVPIAVTALTQQQLTERQVAGGPDLVKEVPNLTFSKTNFSGYNLEIRGIGTQAISVTTDPGVAVALNSIPFIRNHFFEQEFYDLSDAEILRGPQGTLYGRNATAGVVNIVSAKPTGDFESMLSADFGNYGGRRYEGMLNIPIVGDQLDLRIAGEWTKRDGYSFDTTTDSAVDGRDLWSGRLTLGWKPASDVQTYFVWEHFSEDDDRFRSGKQLCKTDPGPTSINGVPVAASSDTTFHLTAASFSQGCVDTSLYSPQAFQVPNGFSLPFISGASYEGILNEKVDPYASTTQSTNLRDIQSVILPSYRAKNDALEFNTDWKINPSLTFTSQTGYNRDYLWSTEDYNRFDTSPGIFKNGREVFHGVDAVSPTGVFCDPQLGCSNRLVVQDLSTERAWQLSQEFRLASSFSGPLNFSVGANYLHYETEENYYVFSNTFTLIALNNAGCNNVYVPNVTNNLYCLNNGKSYQNPLNGGGVPTESPQYLDPNPISSLNNEGHNYFLSQNPYTLNSYALFGETYYDVTKDLKLTAGLRWTDDQKHFVEIPSELLTLGYGYPSTGAVNQSWDRMTGRFVANWSPDLDFTDKSMFYASYAHGYKAGGANPPGPVLLEYNYTIGFPTHPLTFKPEYIEAFEVGTKNSLLDNSLIINADIFYYNYTGYQISQIVDRSAINQNFNANVKGAELESTWEPVPGLRFSFAGGYESTALASGDQSIDLIDRTAGTPGWVVMKPWVGQSSNCIFPSYVAAQLLQTYGRGGEGSPGPQACGAAYADHLDPVTIQPYLANPTVDVNGTPLVGYPGFNPASAPNNGEGFAKNLSGHQLPNAPHFTASLTAEYTVPVAEGWAATFHTDLYWQSQQWARVFEDPIDKIHGYSNVNLSLVLANDAGWQIMTYVKNVFNVTAITGTFLNSDDSGLTTNAFLTDPRLYGIRVTKQFDGQGWPTGGISFIPDLFADGDNGRPPLWIQLGGDFAVLNDSQSPYVPPFNSLIPSTLPSPLRAQKAPSTSFDYEGNVSFQPEGSDWSLSAGIRYGRSSKSRHIHKSLPRSKTFSTFISRTVTAFANKFLDETTNESESHTILDFLAGNDVGLGMFGTEGSSVLSGGVRVAHFDANTLADINSDPDYHYHGNKYHDVFEGTSHAKRSFHGTGPEVTWDASLPIFGNVQTGTINLDWGANGAVLFGRQRVQEHHLASKCHVSGGGTLAMCAAVYTNAGSITRSRNVTIPNLGGFAGFSMRYSNAKVSFGYRIDEFFGAMDGGYATPKRYNRGFYGPYANISIGLGG